MGIDTTYRRHAQHRPLALSLIRRELAGGARTAAVGGSALLWWATG